MSDNHDHLLAKSELPGMTKDAISQPATRTAKTILAVWMAVVLSAASAHAQATTPAEPPMDPAAHAAHIAAGTRPAAATATKGDSALARQLAELRMKVAQIEAGLARTAPRPSAAPAPAANAMPGMTAPAAPPVDAANDDPALAQQLSELQAKVAQFEAALAKNAPRPAAAAPAGGPMPRMAMPAAPMAGMGGSASGAMKPAGGMGGMSAPPGGANMMGMMDKMMAMMDKMMPMAGGAMPAGVAMPGGAMPAGAAMAGGAMPAGAPAAGMSGGGGMGMGMGMDKMEKVRMMGMGAMGGPQGPRIPRIIPNPMDNTLLIQGTTQEYEGIMKLLKDLDVSPRQVLIEARIYEVSLTSAMASGVAYYLQKRGEAGGQTLSTKSLLANLAGGSVNLTAGALVGQSRELLAYLSAQEGTTRTKVISAPSVIATDSIAASINVGTEVPTLAAQAVTGIQSGGNSLFAQNIQNRNSGVTLAITARVNPSGIVTLMINQEVSAPQAPTAGSIQSPSFSKRSVQTQVTVQDGDTIAIGGIINESNTSSSSGIPFLHRLPGIGPAFGSKSISKERTELIVFMTPRVIYDTNDISEASDELKGRLKRLNKIIKED